MRKLFLLLHVSLLVLLSSTPAIAGDPFAGSNVYTQHCVSCHGGDGRGAVAGTPSFREGGLMARSSTELMETVRSGKNLMPAFRGILEETQIDDVITYIRTFN